MARQGKPLAPGRHCGDVASHASIADGVAGVANGSMAAERKRHALAKGGTARCIAMHVSSWHQTLCQSALPRLCVLHMTPSAYNSGQCLEACPRRSALLLWRVCLLACTSGFDDLWCCQVAGHAVAALCMALRSPCAQCAHGPLRLAWAACTAACGGNPLARHVVRRPLSQLCALLVGCV
jgi:hypothetical protein